MRSAIAALPVVAEDMLFERIGAFLVEHGLSPDPCHYAFAHAVLSDPDGEAARAIARLTEGGVRLTRADIERLGGQVSAGAPLAAVQPAPRAVAAPRLVRSRDDQVERLVVQTQSHVDGFADMMRSMHDETRGFGRDLAQSAAAFTLVPDVAGVDEIARVTDAMIARVRDAETRLAQATEETDALRAKLAEARDSARRDPLTGLPNRRAFEEAFDARDPGGMPYCLAVCDIDRFKRVNDGHGHSVGDRVLKAVGDTLASVCVGHLVARHGGEEFAVLLRCTDLGAAAALLNEARSAIGARRFRNRETDAPLGQITISVGVSIVHAGEAFELAFARADRLLYEAKEEGRDRVCAA